MLTTLQNQNVKLNLQLSNLKLFNLKLSNLKHSNHSNQPTTNSPNIQLPKIVDLLTTFFSNTMASQDNKHAMGKEDAQRIQAGQVCSSYPTYLPRTY